MVDNFLILKLKTCCEIHSFIPFADFLAPQSGPFWKVFDFLIFFYSYDNWMAGHPVWWAVSWKRIKVVDGSVSSGLSSMSFLVHSDTVDQFILHMEIIISSNINGSLQFRDGHLKQ